jgi:hypothetical protein
MTDTRADYPMSYSEQRYNIERMRIENSTKYVGRMIWLITLIAGLISMIVVVSVVAIAIIGMQLKDPPKIPDVLSNWGGIILGFYFGQFVNLVKDFMGIVSGSSLPPSSDIPPAPPTPT